MKSYKKATLVAKNGRSGSYAAGCPAQDRGNIMYHGCVDCERTV